MAVIFLAQFGDRKMPRRALQQAHAKPLFEQTDAPAQLGFGQIQGPPRRGKTAVLHHLGKIIEIVEIIHRCSPDRTLELGNNA
ncbi:MAG: hypothetical protein A2Y50_10905 [Pseudomonadales bacterium RIFCSPLOWO2_12_59_9]|nr:MAG: hypothetical protein A2Y50_10905 [Pseudomonadales bacterium RIFCSPLOWO2_12_59_9]